MPSPRARSLRPLAPMDNIYRVAPVIQIRYFLSSPLLQQMRAECSLSRIETLVTQMANYTD